jgi:mRNA-degrading endonuclease toxin of MazEF toxin-antitoxin module
MEKDFDGWFPEKKRIHDTEQHKLYQEREVRWCSLGANVGFEQDGTGVDQQRPVLILKGISRETCYVVPLSTSAKKHRYRLAVGVVDGKEAVALISQIRLIDTKRLVDKIGFLPKETFGSVRKAVRTMF